jgi:hypothetical protein
MPTLTWTGKKDVLRTASFVPFHLLARHLAIEGDSAKLGGLANA